MCRRDRVCVIECASLTTSFARDRFPSGAWTRRVALCSLLGAGIGLVAYGLSSGTAAANEERAVASREADDALRVEVDAATIALRRLLGSGADGSATPAPFAIDIVEVRWRRPAPLPPPPPAFEEADRLEFTEHRSTDALVAWRAAALAQPMDSAFHVIATRNVARLLRASGDVAGAGAVLADELMLPGDSEREELLLRFDVARYADGGERRTLAAEIASGGFPSAPLAERVAIHGLLGGQIADVLGLVALLRLSEAPGSDARVVEADGRVVAWLIGNVDGVHRIALSTRADLLRSLVPSVSTGRAEAVSLGTRGAITLLSPPFPPVALAPGATARTAFQARASAAYVRRLVPALSVAAVLVLCAVLFVVDARRRDRLRRRESAFLLSVTHELKTPIANVRLYAETIAAHGADDPARVPGFVAIIVKEAERLQRRVEEMLDVAAGRHTLPNDHASFRLDRELETVATEWRERFPTRSIVVDEPIPSAALPPVRGTAALFRRVASGLLDNALKFADSGPVALSITRRNGTVEFRVRDEGPGIPPPDRERVFEPFVRLDDAVRRAVPGTGLGLALVRQCVEACGGQVSIEATDGPGTVVCATFAVAPGSYVGA